VIVCHNQAAVLPACLESLLARTGDASMALTVVDSGSHDDIERVARSYPVTFLRGPNMGFAAAVNRALAAGAVGRARYLLLVNPDTEMRTGTLSQLLALCDKRPRCGVVGTHQVDEYGELIPTMAREPSPADYWHTWRTGLPVWHWDGARYQAESRCAWVSGSWMLIRRQALEQVGRLDERFFLYSEETDLCKRIRDRGWEVAYLPQVTVMHRVADRPFNAHLWRVLVWSQLLYMRKWFGVRERASMRLALAATSARGILRARRTGKPDAPDRVALAASLWFRPGRYGPEPEGETSR
jgi:GT2 family glycosyltransferase